MLPLHGVSAIVRAALPVLLALLAVPCAARAQVIEIADDGEARVVSSVADLGAAADSSERAAQAADPFDSAARRYNVDAGLLRALAWTESRGHNEAVSVKGARGIMQLMPATAAELGVDPRDPVANIHGGAAYLARQIATFGQVPLALAAYNAGPGAVLRSGGIPPYAETRAYVATIMQRWSGIAPAAYLAASAAHRVKLPVKRAAPVFVIEVASP